MIQKLQPHRPLGSTKTQAFQSRQSLGNKSKAGPGKTSRPSAVLAGSMGMPGSLHLHRMAQELLLRQGRYANPFRGSNQTYAKPVTGDDRLQAQAAIAEDGEFGVRAVSDRLVNFAISISGGDRSKLEALREAINAGFQAASDALGGHLPDICRETHAETMRKLDAWAQEGTAAAEA